MPSCQTAPLQGRPGKLLVPRAGARAPGHSWFPRAGSVCWEQHKELQASRTPARPASHPAVGTSAWLLLPLCPCLCPSLAPGATVGVSAVGCAPGWGRWTCWATAALSGLRGVLSPDPPPWSPWEPTPQLTYSLESHVAPGSDTHFQGVREQALQT